MIRVLICDDSATARQLLRSIIESHPELSVAGVATNGREAIEMATRLRPDVITMDVQMPELDGIEATKQIMKLEPTPIVVVSATVDPADAAQSMRIIAAGALTVVAKPIGPADADFDRIAAEIGATVHDMSQVSVVRRRASKAGRRDTPIADLTVPSAIGIASSTGGPNALFAVLSGLPADLGAPILVVQHMTVGFTPGLVTWLDGEVPARVKVAEDGELLDPGTVYLAPDHHHLGITSHRVALSESGPIGVFRPSATFLFKSLAAAFGERAAGVVLTGMGVDGVDGLLVLQDRGGLVLAQDEESSVVWGMPGAAQRAGATDRVLPLERIGPFLRDLMGGRWR